MRYHCWNSYTGFLFVNRSSTSWPYWHSKSVVHQPQRTSPVTSDRVKFYVVFIPLTRLYCTNLPEVNLMTLLSVVLLLQSGIRLATTLSVALHLLYLSLRLRHSYSVKHLGLVGSHDLNPSVSTSGVFDILALYKLYYYYYYYYYLFCTCSMCIPRISHLLGATLAFLAYTSPPLTVLTTGLVAMVTESHLLKHGEPQYRCRYCTFATRQQQSLRIHERRIHTNYRPHLCETCGKSFVKSTLLREHINGMPVCLYCNKL